MSTATEKAAELQSRLAAEIESLTTSDDWRRYLDTAARFHNYSMGNLFLILAQRPEATRVAGYRTWQKMNRFVRKGEHGIRILAPARYKCRDASTGEEVWRVRGFTTVTVFDVAQTDGEPLPDVAPGLLSGAVPAGLWDGVAGLVGAAGYVLERGDCGPANGYVEWASRTVRVRDDVDDAQALKTLVHELAHIRLEHETFAGGRAVKECEAESVAYVVCTALGVCTDGYSLPYVAGWAHGDVAAVKATAGRVVKVAAELIDQLGA
jgi:antirestriction protein ArdC